MPRLAIVAFLLVALLSSSKTVYADPHSEIAPNYTSCSGLPISQFESRFPAETKRLTFDDSMLDTFVELWKTGSRPDFPKRPERVIVYALPGLPLIIGFQQRHCIIAYLAVDGAVLWRWLNSRGGVNA